MGKVLENFNYQYQVIWQKLDREISSTVKSGGLKDLYTRLAAYYYSTFQ